MYLDFLERSNETEWMDHPDIDQKELNTALNDISRVNRLLGGNRITIKAVFDRLNKLNIESPVIIDLGCGDGEMLRLLADEARKQKKSLKLIGVDISEKCIVRAKNLSSTYPEISYIAGDLRMLDPADFSCSILICTLTLHHLSDSQIIEIVNKSLSLVSDSVIINDLHRSKIAFVLFKLVSLFLIRSKVARHDGLVSIKRSFIQDDFLKYIKHFKINRYQIKWKWAFRFEWILVK